MNPNTIDRRTLLRSLGTAAAACALAPGVEAAAQTHRGEAVADSFLEVLRQPDAIRITGGDDTDSQALSLSRAGERWSAAGVELTCSVSSGSVALSVHASAVPLRRIHLRWNGRVSDGVDVLGDAWERSYGDLAWLPLQAERPLPWYCLVRERSATAGPTHGYGVMTGAAALAFWQMDELGISLWLDVRNGGCGVRLGDRVLPLATVVTHRGRIDENAFHAAQELCKAMARNVSLPVRRATQALNLYGSNDWYYAYGKNTAAGILRDADLMAEVAPAGTARPFTVVDDGYQDRSRFPDMARLAEQIRQRGVSPGVWVRPLRAASSAPSAWRLPSSRFGSRKSRAAELAFDPTVPEARAATLAVVREAREWGFDLIKHDFTTYELLGNWGNEMGPSPTSDGWSFHDRSRTNAEIVGQLYRDIRSAAGEDRLILGCNTIGHLAAGIFDAQRTGDDVSGRTWERTRRMGVNTLAFRLPQHRIFFAADADCVPITREIPWSMTEQWLRVVAASSTVLLVSPEPGAVGPEQKRALREAMEMSVSARSSSAPIDWTQTRTPGQWSDGANTAHYQWNEVGGADPFGV